MVGTPKYSDEQLDFICSLRYEPMQQIVDACNKKFHRSRNFTLGGIRYVLGLDSLKDRPSNVNPDPELAAEVARVTAKAKDVTAQNLQNKQKSSQQMTAHEMQQLQVHQARLEYMQRQAAENQRGSSQRDQLQGGQVDRAQKQDTPSQSRDIPQGGQVNAQEARISPQIDPSLTAQANGQGSANLFLQNAPFQGAQVNPHGQGISPQFNTFQGARGNGNSQGLANMFHPNAPFQGAQFNPQGLGIPPQSNLFQGGPFNAQGFGNQFQQPMFNAQFNGQGGENQFQQLMFQGSQANIQGMGNPSQGFVFQGPQFSSQNPGNQFQKPMFQGAQFNSQNLGNQFQQQMFQGVQFNNQGLGNPTQLAQFTSQGGGNQFQQPMFQGAQTNIQGAGNPSEGLPFQGAQFNGQGSGNQFHQSTFQGVQVQPSNAQHATPKLSQPPPPPTVPTVMPTPRVQSPANVQSPASGFSTDQENGIGETSNTNQEDKPSTNTMQLPGETGLTMPVAPLQADTAAQSPAHNALNETNHFSTPDVSIMGDNNLLNTPVANLRSDALEKETDPAKNHPVNNYSGEKYPDDMSFKTPAVPVHQHGNTQAWMNNAAEMSATMSVNMPAGEAEDDLCDLERMCLDWDDKNRKPASVTYNLFDPVYTQRFLLPGSDSEWKVSMKERTPANGSQADLPDFTISGGKYVAVNLYRPKFLAGMMYEPARVPKVITNSSTVQHTDADHMLQNILKGQDMAQPQHNSKRPAQDDEHEKARRAKRAKVAATPQPTTPKKPAKEKDAGGLLTPPPSLQKQQSSSMTSTEMVHAALRGLGQAPGKGISLVSPTSSTKKSRSSPAVQPQVYNTPYPMANTAMHNSTLGTAINNTPKAVPTPIAKVSPAATTGGPPSGLMTFGHKGRFMYTKAPGSNLTLPIPEQQVQNEVLKTQTSGDLNTTSFNNTTASDSPAITGPPKGLSLDDELDWYVDHPESFASDNKGATEFDQYLSEGIVPGQNPANETAPEESLFDDTTSKDSLFGDTPLDQAQTNQPAQSGSEFVNPYLNPMLAPAWGEEESDVSEVE